MRGYGGAALSKICFLSSQSLHSVLELDNGGALVLRQEPGFRFVWLQVGAGQADPATVGLPEGNPMLSSRRQA